jgi:hypothetical protein
MGSEPSSNPGDYPSPAEVLAYMRDRRATLMQLLSTMDDAALAKPTPEGAPDFLPDVASIFETAIWHEGMHFGQITVAHRAIGHRPLFDPPAA